MRTFMALLAALLAAACTSPTGLVSAPSAGAPETPLGDLATRPPPLGSGSTLHRSALLRPLPDTPVRPTLDAPSGTPLRTSWSIGYSGESGCCSYASELAVSRDGRLAAAFTYATTPQQGHLYMYSDTGRLLWSMDETGPGAAGLVFLRNGDLVVADSPGGHGASHLRVRALGRGGRVRWTHTSIEEEDHWTSASTLGLSPEGDIIVVGCYRRHGSPPQLLVERLGPRGRLRWSTRERVRTTGSSVAVDSSAVYVASGDDRPWVHALGADGSPLWHLDLPARDQLATGIVVDDSHLFISSRGYGYRAEDVSFLHRIGTNGAHLRSTPLPAPPQLSVAIHSVALGEGGALLIAGALHQHDRPGHDIFVASVARDGEQVEWWDRLGEDGRIAEHAVRLTRVPSGGLALLATVEAEDSFAGLLQTLEPEPGLGG